MQNAKEAIEMLCQEKLITRAQARYETVDGLVPSCRIYLKLEKIDGSIRVDRYCRACDVRTKLLPIIKKNQQLIFYEKQGTLDF